MCYGCWVEYGSPNLQNEVIDIAVGLIGDIYEHSFVGGACHIIVDDFNIGDYSVKFCEQYLEDNLEEWSDEFIDIQRRFLSTFSVMSVSERASALAIYDGYVK